MKFKGKYLNRKKQGKCKEYYENRQLKFEGTYKKGKKNSQCKEYNSDGELIFEVEYLDDKKWNGYIEFEKNNFGYHKVIKVYREILMGRETNKIKE